MLHIPGLYIASSTGRGRGVFTAEHLSPGDLIELCPIVKITKKDLMHIDQTILYEYYFLWEEDPYTACLALGYGSLYNHSTTPNAIVIMDYGDDMIKIQSIEELSVDTEIRIDYTGGTKDIVELWF